MQVCNFLPFVNMNLRFQKAPYKSQERKVYLAHCKESSGHSNTDELLALKTPCMHICECSRGSTCVTSGVTPQELTTLLFETGFLWSSTNSPDSPSHLPFFGFLGLTSCLVLKNWTFTNWATTPALKKIFERNSNHTYSKIKIC